MNLMPTDTNWSRSDTIRRSSDVNLMSSDMSSGRSELDLTPCDAIWSRSDASYRPSEMGYLSVEIS